jgi:hypothetical protein
VSKNNLLAFLCCDCISTLFFLLRMDMGYELIKICYTILVGMAGGFAGLAGKAIFRLCAKWVLGWVRKKTKKPPFKI